MTTASIFYALLFDAMVLFGIIVKTSGDTVKCLLKIKTDQGVVYLAQGDIISKIAMWFQPEHRLLLKAIALESLPLMLMCVQRTPYYFESEGAAMEALDKSGREIQLLKRWVASGKSDLFSYADSVQLKDLDPVIIDVSVELIDVPVGQLPTGDVASRWHVATYYNDQGFLFLEDASGVSPTWIASSEEGSAWTALTEEEALKKSKMITRTESLYAYPRFCVFT